MDQAFATRLPQTCELQDLSGHWWSVQLVPLVFEGSAEEALVICTNVTVERSAAEAVKKEQRLLQRLLDLHERERQLTAYEIHDGFAQQLTGAMYRLQAFRETLARDSDEAWKSFDSAVKLLGRAVDETRRLISGLRPPILNEAGIIEAVDYLICEHRQHGGPQIDFHQDVAFARLAPPLESAIFRIIQESLQNACRHSQSPRVRVSLIQSNHRVCIEVQDWGIGFEPNAIRENRFGLQGIRERNAPPRRPRDHPIGTRQGNPHRRRVACPRILYPTARRTRTLGLTLITETRLVRQSYCRTGERGGAQLPPNNG